MLGATAVLAILLGLVSVPAAAKDAELMREWDASDESNSATIDHASWQQILDRYLLTEHPSGIHRFDYGALKANAEDRQQLGDYLDSLAALDPRVFAKAEQMGLLDQPLQRAHRVRDRAPPPVGLDQGHQERPVRLRPMEPQAHRRAGR